MELSQFENGIQKHNQKIGSSIQNEGLYVMHEQGYSYTVGMKTVSASDLILFGQRPDVAEEMFRVLLKAVKLRLLELRESMIIDHVFQPRPRLVPMTEMAKRSHFYAARTYYGNWSFDVLKVTLPMRRETF